MLGALCNLETIMGNTDTPVRAVFDYGEEHFLRDVPLAYILTVASEQEGRTALQDVYKRQKPVRIKSRSASFTSSRWGIRASGMSFAPGSFGISRSRGL